MTHSTGSGQAGSEITKYYYAGSQRVAMRKNGTLSYMVSAGSTQCIGDHLGSTSIVTDANGTVVSEMRYREASLWDKAWGEERYSWTAGQSTAPENRMRIFHAWKKFAGLPARMSLAKR